jgi:hypothetical protein
VKRWVGIRRRLHCESGHPTSIGSGCGWQNLRSSCSQPKPGQPGHPYA